MMCKAEANGKGELDCLKEGRKVTRCASSVYVEYLPSITAHLLTSYSLSDIDKHCLEEFRKHWSCLDNNNQQLWQCRRYERPLNKCVFDNLVRCNHDSRLYTYVSNRNSCAEVGEDHSWNPGKRASRSRAQETNLRSPQDLDLNSFHICTIPQFQIFFRTPLHDAYLRLALTISPTCLYQKRRDKCFEIHSDNIPIFPKDSEFVLEAVVAA